MGKMIVKAVLLSLLLLQVLWAGDISGRIDKLNQKIPYASKYETKTILHELENFYISAVISGKKSDVIKALQGIIRCQKLLHIDASTYQKELQSLSPHKTTSTNKVIKKKTSHQTKKLSRAIRSIQEKDGHIMIKFNTPLTKEDIFSFKIKNKEGYKNVYDIKANLNFKTPSLHIPALDTIKIAQNRADKVRIVLSDKQKIYSQAFIRQGTLFIKVNAKHNTKTKREKPREIIKKVKVIKKKKSPIMITSKPIKSSSPAIYATSKTIVIDAGHGGHDSGAVGYKKYKEKDAVLKVALLLKKLLTKKGYHVYMSRARDHFISLKKRTHLANKKEADLFISIHANAAPKGKYLSLKGIETFFLSPAKTAKAKRIAAKENAAASAMNRKSKETLLSFLNRNKIIQSNKLAIDIQSNILSSVRKKFKGVKDGGVREAPFWVLVGAQMPAILVEIGYITNPTEGERLFNPFYQKVLAKGIYNGINSYFAHNK